MNAADNYCRTFCFALGQHTISGLTISGTDSDADDVAALHDARVKSGNRFVHERGIADEIDGSSHCHYKKPSGRDDAVAHGGVRRINENDLRHLSSCFLNANSFSFTKWRAKHDSLDR